MSARDYADILRTDRNDLWETDEWDEAWEARQIARAEEESRLRHEEEAPDDWPEPEEGWDDPDAADHDPFAEDDHGAT